jgi:hypothetical protein
LSSFFLLFLRKLIFSAETQKALDFYGNARTKNGKVRDGRVGCQECAGVLFVNPLSLKKLSQGVTIPSQLRYVDYYGRTVINKLEYQPTTLIFKTIHLHGIPNFQNGSCRA